MRDNFLTRWSQRKNSAKHAAADVAAPMQPKPARRDEVSQNDAPLSDADMPPLKSLRDDSDFSGFLSPGVSEELRRRALRRLFSAATFNIRDGLDDYDDDFRNFAALGDLVTCDMQHQRELAEARAKENLENVGGGESDDDESDGSDENIAADESDGGDENIATNDADINHSGKTS